MTPDFFPAESLIPASASIPVFLEQREYLIGGELRRWDGDMNPVASPVWVRQGKVTQ
jgi:glyceraldehyde-3-phosphate dehydrogenase (NADP+)